MGGGSALGRVWGIIKYPTSYQWCHFVTHSRIFSFADLLSSRWLMFSTMLLLLLFFHWKIGIKMRICIHSNVININDRYLHIRIIKKASCIREFKPDFFSQILIIVGVSTICACSNNFFLNVPKWGISRVKALRLELGPSLRENIKGTGKTDCHFSPIL